jgi:hypothetical protein
MEKVKFKNETGVTCDEILDIGRKRRAFLRFGIIPPPRV